MKQPSIIKGKNSWLRYKETIFKVISHALTQLQKKTDLEMNENELNRKLFFCFEEANFDLKLNNHIPVYEGQNPPDRTDEQRAKRESKRPDFYWQFSDHMNRTSRRFVLECKRLGQPNNSWILNKNYIEEGLMRFILKEWGYGQSDDEGVMIGYVEDMSQDKILDEVNQNITLCQNLMLKCTESIPQLPPPANGWQIAGPSHMEHTLTRTFPISPFQLHHFWVDLRGCYDRSILKKSATA